MTFNRRSGAIHERDYSEILLVRKRTNPVKLTLIRHIANTSEFASMFYSPIEVNVKKLPLDRKNEYIYTLVERFISCEHIEEARTCIFEVVD